jgi:hypothetical protein
LPSWRWKQTTNLQLWIWNLIKFLRSWSRSKVVAQCSGKIHGCHLACINNIVDICGWSNLFFCSNSVSYIFKLIIC